MAVKNNIEGIQGKDSYPCGQQLLIHNGKVLNDESTLVEKRVSEDGFLVFMFSKSKTSSSGGISSTQPGPTTVPSSRAKSAPEASVQSLAPRSNSSASAVVTTNASYNTYGEAASNLVAGSNLEQSVQHIMDMGGGSWDKETGIPETVEVAVPVPHLTGTQETRDRARAAAAAATPVSGAPNSSPLNLFPQESVPVRGGVGDGLGPLDILRKSQQFQTLRSMVQANPQILQLMLQELGEQNPHFLRLIQEYNARFFAIHLECKKKPQKRNHKRFFAINLALRVSQ